ncbi:hypothetical protein ACQP2Y_12285 [Actinoplanes sp. CA-051413]|uniref:hypothetical protein n=1 Tax=Actinoplanes sp. CA-051413 TaxID=3239899 RepID=UPI003D98CA87
MALPMTLGKYVARAGTRLMERADVGTQVAKVKLNARVEITGQADAAHADWSSVIVTEGLQTGKQGWVKTALLDDLTRKKSI